MNSDVAPIGLDRHHLHNIRNAYIALNESRIQQAYAGMTEDQRCFMEVLPALLHFNHPLLPGFVNRQTPFGVYRFQLSEGHTEQLRKLSRSFRPTRPYLDFDQKHHSDILAIYAMGSFGTMAQNSKSDVDLWICHRADLNRKALLNLEKKCQALSDWAARTSLPVTFFLMDPNTYQHSFRLDFGREASGTTQHMLLLDEFYRASVLLAGQLPAWLFVAAEQEAHYPSLAKGLTVQRLLPDKALVDFGPVRSIAASEYISAAIWQLYKAIDSPYKSILKLVTLEAYCQDSNALALLSMQFKQQLHGIYRRGNISLWEADPYLKIYQLIEKYLVDSGQESRLEFLRRCFYFKLDQPLSNNNVSARASAILALVREWQWDTQYVEYLDDQGHWPLQAILNERRLMIDELNHSYQFIMKYFYAQQEKITASNKELNVLGRKLHAAFSRKTGKIEWVSPLVSNNIAEKTLLVSHSSKDQYWLATDTTGETIAKKNTCVELLAWLHCNRVLASKTQLFWQQYNRKDNSLEQVRQHITRLITLPINSASHEAFEQSCRMKKLVFFINFSPLNKITNEERKSLDLDLQQNCRIECLTLNSWNEIVVYNKQGPLLESLMVLYVELLKTEGGHFAPNINCICYDQHLQAALKVKTANLFSHLSNFFHRYPYGRFLTRLDQRFMMISFNKENLSLDHFVSDEQLKQQLMKPLEHCSPVSMDNLTLGEHPFAILADYFAPNSLQIFFRPRGKFADITLIDENGAWFETTIDFALRLHSLQALHRFLRAVNERCQSAPVAELGPLDIFPINFYRMMHGESGWYVDNCIVSSRLSTQGPIPISAAVHFGQGEFKFVIELGGRKFSEIDQSDAVEQWATEINSSAPQSKGRPFAVVDLDLSNCRNQLAESGRLQTIHYLKVKAILEAKLNKALRLIKPLD